MNKIVSTSLLFLTGLYIQAGETSLTPVAKVHLKSVEVFDLHPETQRMALRGIIGAGNQNKLAGVNVSGVVHDAPMSERPPMTAEAFTDPWRYEQTTFSKPVPYEFDFGNGVVKALPLIRVHNVAGRGWKEGLLLNLAYSGELAFAGKTWQVEVVQGAEPGYNDRLAYPGFFNDPGVSVLLYDKVSGERLEASGRLKRIDGVWYNFESNASGEELTVHRMDAVGRIAIDAGEFQQDDFAFLSGYFETASGGRMALDELVFENGVTEVPAATYTFNDLQVRNHGKNYRLLWPGHLEPAYGSLTVPAEGTATFEIGKRARMEIRNTSGIEVHGLFDLEKFSFELVDLDLGARVMPLSKEPYRVTSYRNSAGEELPRKFSGKLCGWTGEYIQLGNNRIGKKGPMVLTSDPNPPAVEDTHTFTVTADFAGLYGRHSGEMKIRVRNQAFRLHGEFYDFDEEPAAFPDFATLRPDRVVPDARMSAKSTLAPWPGLPAEMADSFGAVYTCEILPSSMGKGISHYRFELSCQGTARLYVDDTLVMEHSSPQGITRKVAEKPITLMAGGMHNIRIEYLHGNGPSALTVWAEVETEPYYRGVLQLDPDQPGFDGVNDAWISEGE